MHDDWLMSMTPTMNSELLLSAQLGVSKSEPSISEPAVSKDLEIELSMGTSEARAHQKARTYSKCTERVSATPRLCRTTLNEVEICEESGLVRECDDVGGELLQRDGQRFYPAELPRKNETNGRAGSLLVVPDQLCGGLERWCFERDGESQALQ